MIRGKVIVHKDVAGSKVNLETPFQLQKKPKLTVFVCLCL